MFRPVSVVRMAAVLSLLAFSAWASLVSDKESTTYFATTPENARRELHGQDFTRVLETPNSLTLPAVAAPIAVACSAEGYRTTTATLDTSAHGWGVGNALFGLLGGPIGLIIDASRGAGQTCPPQFNIILDPASFATDADRDAWYDARRAEVEASWAQVIEEVQQSCGRNNARTSCQGSMAAVEKKRDEEIAAIEQRRDTASIVAAQ